MTYNRTGLLLLLVICSPLPAHTQYAPLQPQDGSLDVRAQELVLQLTGLPHSPSRTEFINRPPMRELVVLGPYAYAPLKREFLSTKDWSVKASTAYLLFTLGNGLEFDTGAHLTTLLGDEHPTVRTVAAALKTYGAMASDARSILERSEEAAILSKLSIRAYEGFLLSEGEQARSTDYALQYVDQEAVLTNPPLWYDSSGVPTDKGDLTSIAFGGSRVLQTAARVAHNNIIGGIGASEGHSAIRQVLSSAVSDNRSDGDRLGFKLRLLSSVLSHKHPNGAECKDLGDFTAQVARICETVLKTSNNAWCLGNALNSLCSAAGLGNEQAMRVLEELRDSHSNPEVRKLALKNIERLRSRFAQETAAKEEAAAIEKGQNAPEAKLKEGDPRTKKYSSRVRSKPDESPSVTDQPEVHSKLPVVALLSVGLTVLALLAFRWFLKINKGTH